MSISQGNLITATDVNNHINNKSNPHEVTAAQSGAVIANFGYIDNADLIAWATAQTQSCFFAVNPNVTTTNVPAAEQWYSGILNVGNGLKSIILISLTTGNIYYNRTISSVFQTWSQSSKEGHTHSGYATTAYVDSAIANSKPAYNSWSGSLSEGNNSATYSYKNNPRSGQIPARCTVFFNSTAYYYYGHFDSRWDVTSPAAQHTIYLTPGSSISLVNSRGTTVLGMESSGRLYIKSGPTGLGGSAFYWDFSLTWEY